MKTIKCVAATILFTFTSVFAFADGDETYIPQVMTPNAASFAVYGKTPVSHYTGLPEITGPITELQAKGHSLPVYLSYHAGNIKPDVHPGWVGLGWTLNAGGCISRRVNGFMDERSGNMTGSGNLGFGYFNLNRTRSFNQEFITSNNAALYAIEYSDSDYCPDEFMINVDGLSASFYVMSIDEDTGDCDIHIVSKSDKVFKVKMTITEGEGNNAHVLYQHPDIGYQLYSSLYEYISKIEVTDTFGTVYTFGGNMESIELTHNCNPTPVIQGQHRFASWNVISSPTSWYLTQIKYTNGETVTLEYEKDGLPIVVSDAHYLKALAGNENEADIIENTKDLNPYRLLNKNFTILEPSYLKRIESSITGDRLIFLRGRTTELKYEFDNNDFAHRVDWLHELGGDNDENPFTVDDFRDLDYYMKLTGIVGRRLRWDFEYDESASTRLHLDAVKFKNTTDNEYYQFSFTYNSTQLPQYNSRKTDAWGYYNNKDYSSVGYDQLKGYRTVNENYLYAEVLTRVIYPTGGYTDYEYESNDYSHIYSPYQSTEDLFLTSIGKGGGIRIKRITDNDGERLRSRRFIYKNEDGTSSGTLTDDPVFHVTGYYGREENIPKWQIITRFLSYNTHRGFNLSGERCISQLSSSGNDVTYGRVKEVFQDSSYIVYTYSDQISCPDEPVPYFYSNYDNMSLTEEVSSRELERGLITSRTSYKPNGTITSREEYEYQSDTSQCFYAFKVKILSPTKLKRVSPFRIWYFFPCLERKTETSYSTTGGPAVTLVSEYTYDEYRNVTSVRRSSGDDYAETRTTYSGEMTGNIYRYGMQNKNMMSLPVEQLGIHNGKVVNGTLLTYNHNNTNLDYVLSNKYILDVSAPIEISQFQEYTGVDTIPSHYLSDLTNMVYDRYSNLVEYKTSEGHFNAIYWGYGSVYPVAFVNSGITRLSLSDSSLINGYTSYMPDNKLLSLRNNGHLVEAFRWEEYVGLIRQEDVSGRARGYTYDNFGRLSGIVDEDGILLSSYEYSIPGKWRKTKRFNSGGTYAEDIEYYDGLGYLIQENAVNACPDEEKDIILRHTYDDHWRESKKWLPYVKSSSASGAYDSFSEANQKSYYRTLYGISSTDPYAYSTTLYEENLNGRKIGNKLPGVEYQPDSKMSGISYSGNDSDEVLKIRFIDASGAVEVVGTYPAGTLFKTVNLTPDGVTTVEWKDVRGLLICSGTGSARTYYVYDGGGRVRWIIQPEGSKDLTEDSVYTEGSYIAKKFSFLYHYDSRGHIIGKRNPGGSWTNWALDTEGKPLVKTDERILPDSLLFQYDDNGRLVLERLASLPPAAEDGVVDPQFGSYVHEYYYGSTQNTDFRDIPGVTADSLGTLRDERMNGMVGHERLKIIGTIDEYLHRTYHYDKYGRVIQVVDNDIHGCHRRSTKYDLIGNVLTTHEETVVSGDTTTVVVNNTFDTRSRLTCTDYSCSGENIVSVQYSYDDLGRLSGRVVSFGDNTISETYSNNLQNRNTGKSVSLNGVVVYSDELRYENPLYGASPCYWGNISEWKYSHLGGQSLVNRYTYDDMSRLTGVSDLNLSSGHTGMFNERDIVYDLNGNILSLTRTINGNEENCQFEYDGNNNLSYEYDSVGDAVFDENLGYDLVYNDIGLLEQISQTDLGSLMKIYYLSDGTKYRVEDIVNEDLSDGPFYDRLYIGSMIFVKTSEDSTYSLESISVPGGQIVPDGDGGYRYRHFVTDHLGSVRAVIDWASVSRTADYLPYGTSNNPADSLQFRWQFNGKEKIPNEAVPYYDYGARMYDTSIGSWLTQDPLADSYPSVSPYSFCAGNPINRVDPDGLSWYFDIITGEFLERDFDGDETIFMISRDQFEQAKQAENFTEALSSFREDIMNSFAQLFIERRIEDAVAENVVSYLYDYANRTEEGGRVKIVPAGIKKVIVDRSLGGDYATKTKSRILSVGSPAFTAYDNFTLLAHEMKHQLDKVQTDNPYYELIADKFATKHWAYPKTSAYFKKRLEQHIKENEKKLKYKLN